MLENLSKLDHPNIVKCEWPPIDERTFAMEYCSGGDLDILIAKGYRFSKDVRSHSFPLQLSILWYNKGNHYLFDYILQESICYMLQIADAVQYLHKSNHIHRDIKLSNILVQPSSSSSSTSEESNRPFLLKLGMFAFC